MIAFEHVGSDPIIFNLTPDRITTKPQGLGGGARSKRPRFVNGRELEFPPIRLLPGDVVELRLGGGGGSVRSPSERERPSLATSSLGS